MGKHGVKLSRLFERLSVMYEALGDKYRAIAYENASEIVLGIPDADLKKGIKPGFVPGIGESIARRIDEYFETGKIKDIDRMEKAYEFFSTIPGFGAALIRDLVSEGITNIKELRESRIKLTQFQEIGLKYRSQLAQRIPRDEVKGIAECIMDRAGSFDYKICGSYARGRPDSGDVDILVLSARKDTVMRQIAANLSKHKDTMLSAAGDAKISLIYKQKGSPARAVDIMIATPEEFPTFELYFTGSKRFNTSMRAIAKSQGFLLNQYGLFKDGKRIETKTQRDVFKKIGMKYVAPSRRE